MTALSLREIVDGALANVGVEPAAMRRLGVSRSTSWDEALPGFGVRTYASGRSIYVVQARMAGRLRTITLCSTRLISRKHALDVARRILLRVQTERDPAQDRLRVRATSTFPTFLDLYWDRASPNWKPSTRVTHDKYRRLYLDGAFRRRGLDRITQADVATWFADVAERAGQGGANRVLTILKAAFNKAEDWGLLPANSNPTVGIRSYPQKRFARFLREDELARLGAALDQEAAEFPVHVAAVRLLLLTGCRMSEITGLMWSEVVGTRLKLTDSKTGPRTVWLGVEASALLDTFRLSNTTAQVFWDDRRDRPLELPSFWAGFRKRHGFAGLRIHDLRHSFASHAAAMSETLPMIGKLLGHSEIQTTARYAHLDDSDLTATTQIVGDALEQMLGKPPLIATDWKP